MTNRTFIMCKPDAVERGLVGEIISRIERKGLTLVAAELRTADRALAEAHYDEHKERPFFGELVDFLTRGPVMAMIVEGPDDNTFSICRTLIGKTSVDDALLVAGSTYVVGSARTALRSMNLLTP